MLDWTDELKYTNFGLNKHVTNSVKFSDFKPPPRN